MKGIELEVYWNSPEQVELNDIGIETSITECDVRKVKFYSISAICPYVDDGLKLCLLHSGGQRFIVNKTYDEVKSIIDNF